MPDIENQPYPLGRIIQHDERSRGFALPESDLSTLSSKKWTRYAPIFNQGNLGSCTGNACLGALGTGILFETLKTANKLPEFTQKQAVDIYSKASAIDQWPGQYPPEDTGSSGLAVAKVAKEAGWISSYLHAFSFNAALTALQTGPVITGISWYGNFTYPYQTGECVIDPYYDFVSGGHEIVIDQIDIENQRIWFTNSWGENWGLDGRAWFHFDLWEKLLDEMGDVTQLIPIEISGPPIPPDPPTPDEADGCLVKIVGPWATKVLGQKSRTKKDKAVAQAIVTWEKAKGLL